MVFCCRETYAQVLRINEVMSSNTYSLYDEDWSTPDWIEVYNGGTEPVDLAGFGISDKKTNPFKWVFPDYTLDNGKYLVLAASGKDRKEIPMFWETVISANDTFRYIVPATDPGAWRIPGFSDENWVKGRSGFGYGDEDDSTVVPSGTVSVFARKSFVIYDLSGVKQMKLHVDYDDAFVAYLNGHEIARAGIGTIGIPPAWNDLATSGDHEATIYQGGSPDVFPCDSAIMYLVPGINLFAIEVHNNNSGSTDLSCTPFLTLGLSKEPVISRGTPEILKLGSSLFHLNFKISASGDTLFLTDPSGVLVDSLSTGVIPSDISLGLQPDGTGSRWFFDKPTPGRKNDSKAYEIKSYTDPVFSIPGGMYITPVDLEISGGESGDSILYTLDGSEPKRGNFLYSGPIHLTISKVVRAVLAGPAQMKRKPVTRSYLFRPVKPTLTTISLSTDPQNFFNWDTGIYVLGPHASPDNPNFGANFWEDWERPVHIELFEKDGTPGLETDAGVKIFGAWSRANPQKSLAFYARGRYGADAFRYKLFPELHFTEYNNFILRNSGNDWNNTMFRDALMCSLLDQTDLDRMAYRPASVYLNGNYWGLLNIREKINEHFLAAHHGVEPYQIDLLEANGSPLNGDAEHYNQMLDFLYWNTPFIKTNYEKVKTMMDVENFMEYEIAQIYFNNTDWPGNNIKFWRPRTPDGRWRWIVFDTDFGFGIWNDAVFQYSYNTLAFALATNGPDWPNPPWATFLLRKMMENQDFKNEFINRFADRLNTAYSYSTVLQHIDQMSNAIAAEIPYHLARWNQWGENLDTWKANVNIMRTFASNRVSYMRNFISQQFSFLGYTSLKIVTSSYQSGKVKLNTLVLSSFPWEGIYFKRVPVQITAWPNPGYRFVMWEGPVADPMSAATTVTLSDKTTVKAVFEPDGSGLNEIVINEIYYYDPPEFDADDWVELYNKGINTIDLSDWILKDEVDTHRFVLPPGTILYPKEFLVLSRNVSKFEDAYPDKDSPVGDFGFGLGSSGDCIRLFTADSVLVDSVRYGVSDPWPEEPGISGVSLEFIRPDYDNSLAVNWSASLSFHGTPGEINSMFTGTKEHSRGTGMYVRELECFPNPFSVLATLRYEIAEPGWFRLAVYDLQGNLINTLSVGESGPGMQEFIWDGCKSDGTLLGPGIYIGVLETTARSSRCRIVIIR